MRIIPAIDLLNGKCVRLSKGDYATEKVYKEDPLELAKAFEGHGLQFLHLVDLDGARFTNPINYRMLEKITTHTRLRVDFGGGIKSDEAIKRVFGAGASKVNVGSMAITNFTGVMEWLKLYGPDRLVLAADCRNRKIVTHGWIKDTAVDVLGFIKSCETRGFRDCVCTDVSKDGMLEGPSLLLYQEILAGSKINLVASGGVSSIADIRQLRAIGCEGVIVGKAIYEGRISLKELSELC